MLLTLIILASLLAAAIASFVLRALYQSPVIGAALVAVLVLAEALLVEMPQVKADVSLYPHDIACGLFAVAALLRLLWVCRLRAGHFLLIGLCVCFAYSLWRGVQEFGLQPAGNEARGTAYALCAAFYFMTFSYDERTREKLFAVTFWCGCALAALALFRWTSIVLHIPVPGNWADVGGDKPIRVINASQTLIICEAALLAWALPAFGRRRSLLKYILPAIVLILQHRTVWIAGAAGFAWYFLTSYGKRGSGGALKTAPHAHRSITVARCVIPGAILLGLIYLFAGDALVNFLQDSIFESTRGNSTLTWRIAGWQELLADHLQLGPVALLLGQPFGAGFNRTINGVLWDQSPHSYFVQIILRTGLTGLLLLLGIYGRCFSRLARSNGNFPNTRARLMQAWLVTQFVYFLAYSPGIEQGMLLGLVVGCVSVARSRPKHFALEWEGAFAAA